MKKWIVIGLVLAMASGAWAAKFSLEGVFDYETAETALLWWADPNGGLGVMVSTDSSIPESTENNFAVGPCVEFTLDPIYQGLLATVFPFLPDLPDVPLTTFGRIGAQWELSDGGDFIGSFATGIRLAPGKWIQPTIMVERVQPEGSANIDAETRFLVGATVWLGK